MALNEMRDKLEYKQRQQNINCSLQTSINFDNESFSDQFMDVCCQTRAEDENECIDKIDQILSLTETIREKDQCLMQYQKEGEQMFEVIEKMEIQINENQHRYLADKEVIHRLEEKLRR